MEHEVTVIEIEFQKVIAKRIHFKSQQHIYSVQNYEWRPQILLMEVKLFTTNNESPAMQRSDGDTIIRMLYYCADEPRLESQIRTYSELDRAQFVKFIIHCIKRGMLKVVMTEDMQHFVTTERGKQVLATTENIMQSLGISPEVEK